MRQIALHDSEKFQEFQLCLSPGFHKLFIRGLLVILLDAVIYYVAVGSC